MCGATSKKKVKKKKKKVDGVVAPIAGTKVTFGTYVGKLQARDVRVNQSGSVSNALPTAPRAPHHDLVLFLQGHPGHELLGVNMSAFYRDFPHHKGKGLKLKALAIAHPNLLCWVPGTSPAKDKVALVNQHKWHSSVCGRSAILLDSNIEPHPIHDLTLGGQRRKRHGSWFGPVTAEWMHDAQTEDGLAAPPSASSNVAVLTVTR